MIRQYLHKTLSLLRLGKRWFQQFVACLIEAGRTISYLETIEPSKSDSLHKAIKQADKEVFKREFEKTIRKALKKLKLKKVKLAIDGTEDPYWGKYGSFNTRARVHEKSDESWQYVTLSIVEPFFLPLMSVPYRQIDDLDTLTIDLLEYARTLPFKIELVLFDRGFYHAHLIDYLENKEDKRPLPYLIFVPKNNAMKNYIAQTKGRVAMYRHQMSHCRDKTKWKPKTNIAVCKKVGRNKKGKWYDWCFATNQKKGLYLVREYRKRWNIETGFRIHDEAKIKTKSSNPLIRYFYHLFSMLLIICWRVRNKIKGYEVFKRFLRIVEYALREHILKDPT